MAHISKSDGQTGTFQTKYVMLGVAGALLLIGLVGVSHAAVGYGLFLISTLLLGAGLSLLGLYALTRLFETGALRRAFVSAFWMGAWGYVWAVAALAGYFIHEALAGRIEWKFIIFGPVILAAIIILDVGIWRVIVERNRPTIDRIGDLWTREALDQGAMRRALLDEVVLHRSLLAVSPFRWLRHQLIFWGFGLMFVVEVVAVAFREAFPAFGWTDLWYEPAHPVRLAFDFAYDFTGLMVLIGCVLALAFRMMVQGREEQKYTDTPTALFLLVVVVTGFLVEGSRMALAADAPAAWVSFVGMAFAPISPSSPAAYETIWMIHMFAACGFIAYVPLKRMIHSCATPIGRLLSSQQALMAEKKRRVLGGLFRS